MARLASVSVPIARPPALEQSGRPFPAAEPERQGERQYDPGQNDEKRPLHDVAPDLDLAECDHDHERRDEILRDLAEQVRVGNLRFTAIGGDGSADEAANRIRKSRRPSPPALRGKQYDALQQIGDVGETEPVKGNDQRRQNDQPVRKQSEQRGRIAL